MDFKKIVDTVMNKCNVDTDDIQGIDVIKLGINEAYYEIAKAEGFTITTPVPIINGIVSLPDDLFEIKKIVPELLDSDYISGSRIFTDHKGSLNITYSYTPEELINDTDIPEISIKFIKALIHFGCFSYYQFKKKDKVAVSYMNSYERLMSKFNKEYLQDKIVEVFTI